MGLYVYFLGWCGISKFYEYKYVHNNIGDIMNCASVLGCMSYNLCLSGSIFVWYFDALPHAGSHMIYIMYALFEICMCLLYRVWCCYDTVFSKISQQFRYGVPLWVETLSYVQSRQFWMHYHIMVDHSIMVPDCTCNCRIRISYWFWIWHKGYLWKSSLKHTFSSLVYTSWTVLILIH